MPLLPGCLHVHTAPDLFDSSLSVHLPYYLAGPNLTSTPLNIEARAGGSVESMRV